MSYDVNSLEAHWMPFSANRDFKKNPRMVVKSEGMYMWDYKGGQIIDGSSALFCTPAGHGRREIAGTVDRVDVAAGQEVDEIRCVLLADDGQLERLF
ncbi:MAG: hypothetical protein ACPHIV_07295, partial [Candidatus Puniceispirillaceae bacterium]